MNWNEYLGNLSQVLDQQRQPMNAFPQREEEETPMLSFAPQPTGAHSTPTQRPPTVTQSIKDVGLGALRAAFAAPRQQQERLSEFTRSAGLGDYQPVDPFQNAGRLIGAAAKSEPGQEVIQNVLTNLANTPMGQAAIRGLQDENTLEKISSFLSMFEDYAEDISNSAAMFEADEYSAVVAQWLIDNNIVPFPEETSGAGGRPLMMDIAKNMGANAIEALGVEVLMPAYIPSLGMVPGIVGGFATRPAVGVGQMATKRLREIVNRLVDQTPELAAKADEALEAFARVAPTQGLPEALRSNQVFQKHLDDVMTRAANEGPESLRVWTRPEREIWGADTIARGPDGAPLLKGSEASNGLTPGELKKYNKYRQDVIAAHGSMDALEANLLEAVGRAEGVPAADWYPQQTFLNRIQDAVGDDVTGRAIFEYWNDVQARYSTRASPKNQALRAAWTFVTELMGAHPAEAHTVPRGMGSLGHTSQVVQVGRGLESPAMFTALKQPKNYTYAQSLSGNLGDIVVDIHYARSMLNNPKFSGGDDLSIGAYLALRDLGMEIAQKNGMRPGDFQQRVWVGNAKFTEVGGKKAADLPIEEITRPFDVEAQTALDQVLQFLATESGATFGSTDEILAAVLRNDPVLRTGLERRTPYSLLGAEPAESGEALIRTLNSEDLRGILENAASEGLLQGKSDFLTALFDPASGYRLMSSKEKLAAVETLASKMRESGGLSKAEYERAVEVFGRMDTDAFNRVGHNYLALDRQLDSVRSSIKAGGKEGGGFTVDFDTAAVPVAHAGIRGFSVGAYPTLSRSFTNYSPSRIPDMLVRYIFDNAEFLDKSRHGVGGWVDPSTKKLVLDVVVVSGSRQKSKLIAEVSNQKGIYNFGAKSSDETFMDTVTDAQKKRFAKGLQPEPGAVPQPTELLSRPDLERWYRQQAKLHYQQNLNAILNPRDAQGRKRAFPGLSYPPEIQ